MPVQTMNTTSTAPMPVVEVGMAMPTPVEAVEASNLSSLPQRIRSTLIEQFTSEQKVTDILCVLVKDQEQSTQVEVVWDQLTSLVASSEQFEWLRSSYQFIQLCGIREKTSLPGAFPVTYQNKFRKEDVIQYFELKDGRKKNLATEASKIQKSLANINKRFNVWRDHLFSANVAPVSSAVSSNVSTAAASTTTAFEIDEALIVEDKMYSLTGIKVNGVQLLAIRKALEKLEDADDLETEKSVSDNEEDEEEEELTHEEVQPTSIAKRRRTSTSSVGGAVVSPQQQRTTRSGRYAPNVDSDYLY